jgi:hypothetical protein
MHSPQLIIPYNLSFIIVAQGKAQEGRYGHVWIRAYKKPNPRSRRYVEYTQEVLIQCSGWRNHDKLLPGLLHVIGIKICVAQFK